MVKMVKGRKGNKKKTVRAPKAQIVRGPALDQHASAYARLLADPCAGPLVSGPFGDGGGGFVSRFETDFIVNSSGTDTSAVVAFVPALAQVYGSSTAIPTDATAITFFGNNANSPGYSYLLANAGSFRCLSACIQAYWPGSELSRAGIVSLGQYPSIVAFSTPTTAAIRSAATYVERIPDQMSEIVWRPNNFDVQWSAPATESGAITEKASALIVSAAGIPVSTGMRFRVVAVYEWQPLTGTGLVQSQNRGTLSRNTFQDVVMKLDSLGDWMYHGALSVGKAASSVYAGVRAIGQVAYGGAKMAAMLTG